MDTYETRVKVGKRIKELRLGNNLTQAKFAAMIGVSRGSFANIERGNHNFSFDTFTRIVSGLGVTFGEFFAGVDGAETLLRKSEKRQELR